MILLCGQEAGKRALKFFRPEIAVCYDDETEKLAKKMKIRTYKKLVLDKFTKKEKVILSVHGREIVGRKFLRRFHCYNIHPFLYCYKGKNPTNRAIEDRNWRASVGLHYMTEEVDRGERIHEPCKTINPSKARSEVYEQIYDLYEECFEYLAEASLPSPYF